MPAKSYHSDLCAYALFNKWSLESNPGDTKLASESREGGETEPHRIE